MAAIQTTTIRRVICLAEAIVSFVLACYAAPQLLCHFQALEPFQYCGSLALVFTVLSMVFLIPSLVLWFHTKAGALFQLAIPIGVAWVVANYA